jgi:hypothetical protein
MATKIRQSNLDPTVISGNTALGEIANNSDSLLIFDASSGTLKKVTRSNFNPSLPTFTSVSPTTVNTGDGTGNHTFVVTGTNFVAGTTIALKNTSGGSISFASQTLNSATQITGIIAKSSMPDSGEPYDIVITGPDGTATGENQININAQPVFVTSAGSLGTFAEQTTISTINIIASDPESAGNVSFEFQSGSLPAGLSSTTVHEDGVSKFRITGTLSTDVGGAVVTTFTLRAVDAASNTSSRTFTITETPAGTQSFTSGGTFSVPAGVTTVNVLVVGGGAGGGANMGGGGGAGGLIFMPNFPVTPSGTVSVAVGDGGPSPGGTGGDSEFGTLTAKGGGGGGGPSQRGEDGGSGGGSAHNSNPTAGGQATQPSQPGDSGAYGFGNDGGSSAQGTPYRSGGGGGAGSAGQPGPSAGGGSGKAYTIADGTTSVTYAGGGGGRGQASGGGAGPGGPGGGGAGGASGTAGQANKGGGGGGSGWSPEGGGAAGNGGKGIVIVKYPGS